VPSRDHIARTGVELLDEFLWPRRFVEHCLPMRRRTEGRTVAANAAAAAAASVDRRWVQLDLT